MQKHAFAASMQNYPGKSRGNSSHAWNNARGIYNVTTDCMEFNKNDYFERIRRYPQQQEILKNSRKQKMYRCIKKMP